MAQVSSAPVVALAVLNNGEVTIDQVELPGRSAGEIDVAITMAAICGSDLHTVLGHRSSPPRTALGHEGVGTVVDTDAGTRDLAGAPLRRGDRVVFSMLSACGSCDHCAAGLTMKCRLIVKYGHESVKTPPFATGTLATAVRLLPAVPVLRVPDHLSDAEVISAGCAVATAAAVVDAAGPLARDSRAVVFGAGAVGAYCTAMLASLGSAVEVRDPRADRRELAGQLGATSSERRGSYPLVIEASGSPTAFAEAVEAAELGGRIIAAGSVSPGNTSVKLDPAEIVTRRLTLVGVHNYTARDFQWGVRWLGAHGHGLGLERLTSTPFALSSVGQAFAAMRDGSHLRVLVQPN